MDKNIPVAFFSLEMSSVQLAKRMIRNEAKFSKVLLEGFDGRRAISEQELAQLESSLTGLSAAPLFIDDTPGLKVTEFHEKAKKLVDENGIRLIVIDYLQLMAGPEEFRGLREEEVSFIARTLKSTAKELNIPIIALSQISRMIGRLNTGRPELSQLRESESIEEVADSIILIHRPDILGLSERPEDREACCLIVAKNRNGGIGEVSMSFSTENLAFKESNNTVEEPEPKVNLFPIHSKKTINPHLNPNYTFRNFIMAAPNLAAVKAGKAFVNGKNRKGQLLLIGPSGSGKTHLVNAIGNATNSEAIVLYVTGDEFMNQYMKAVKSNRRADFREYYSNVDVLIFDNLQDLIGAGAQNAFLHIIDHINQIGKHLVFTSSRSLDELKDIFDERTIEHLTWGKVVEIGKLDK